MAVMETGEVVFGQEKTYWMANFIHDFDPNQVFKTQVLLNDYYRCEIHLTRVKLACFE